jgi:hypothetical protein
VQSKKRVFLQNTALMVFPFPQFFVPLQREKGKKVKMVKRDKV